MSEATRPTEEQKERIRAVIARIEAKPEQFQMSHWCWNQEDRPVPLSRDLWDCNTVACIAGHACLDAGAQIVNRADIVTLIDPETGDEMSTQDRARDLLGLPTWVFHLGQWPEQYQEMAGEEEDFCRHQNEATAACALLRELLNDDSPLWKEEEEDL